MKKSFGAVLRVVLRGLWVLGVAALGAASVMLLDAHGLEVVRAGMSRGFLTFGIAVTSVVLAALLVFWRFKIEPVEVFNVIESDPKAAAGFLGALVLGLCLLAGAVFGTF